MNFSKMQLNSTSLNNHKTFPSNKVENLFNCAFLHDALNIIYEISKTKLSVFLQKLKKKKIHYIMLLY